ncbi:MAG TPA: hypothetical protein VK742_07795 [Candidatus Sulfotelmatobacter sp.]|nr:hypothetical protein [Candidatus Sulfotelmatobacter sp.]
MRTILEYSILIAAAIYCISLVAARYLRCPVCGKHAVQKVEGTRFWKRYACRGCGKSYVEDH